MDADVRPFVSGILISFTLDPRTESERWMQTQPSSSSSSGLRPCSPFSLGGASKSSLRQKKVTTCSCEEGEIVVSARSPIEKLSPSLSFSVVSFKNSKGALLKTREQRTGKECCDVTRPHTAFFSRHQVCKIVRLAKRGQFLSPKKLLM